MAVAPRMYARSLFQAAKETNSLDVVHAELGEFAAAVDEVPELRGLLSNPQIERDDRAAALREILADRLLGGNGRPPRPAEDFSDHQMAAELDRLCADHGFGRMAELDAGELAALTEALDAFEMKVSAQRQQVFAELDALTDELVEHYREQQVEGS